MIQEHSFSVERGKYGVGISWDRARKDVDLDLQMLVVDSQGMVVDAIYHNNLKALDGAICHSGDARAGGSGNELVWVDTGRLPTRIKLLIFVVAACSGGHLVDVRKGLISVVDFKDKKPLAKYNMENSNGDVDAVVLMKRESFGRWKIGPIDIPAVEGESFLDMMDVIGKLIRMDIPQAPKHQSLAYTMDKDEGTLSAKVQAAVHARNRRRVGLPLATYCATLSWSGETDVDDMDLQTLVVDERGIVAQVVDYTNVFSVGHDIISGGAVEEAYDPETREKEVRVDLAALDSTSRMIIFVVVLKSGAGLETVSDVSMVLTDATTEKSKARFGIDTEGVTGNLKLFMTFYRRAPGSWEMLESDEGQHEASHAIVARPIIGSLVREFVPQAPQDRMLFRLNFGVGGALRIPDAQDMRRVSCSVCWNMKPNLERTPSLRVSALMIDGDHRVLGVSSSLHSGASRSERAPGTPLLSTAGSSRPAGEEAGHTMGLSLHTVAKSVEQVLLLIAASEPGESLDGLQDIFCHLLDREGAELARFAVPSLSQPSACTIVARWVREDASTWVFQAVGMPCAGHGELGDVEFMTSAGPLLNLSPRLAMVNPLVCEGKQANESQDMDSRELRRRYTNRFGSSASMSSLGGAWQSEEDFEAPMPSAVQPQLLLSTLTTRKGPGRRRVSLLRSKSGVGSAYDSRRGSLNQLGRSGTTHLESG